MENFLYLVLLFEGVNSGTVSITQAGTAILGHNGPKIICDYTLNSGETLRQMELLSTIAGSNLDPVVLFDPGFDPAFVNINTNRNFSSRVILHDFLAVNQSGIIEFTGISCVDELVYQCATQFRVGSNFESKRSEVLDLLLIVPAQTPELFLADNITIIEGSNVTMWCVGDVGYPPAQIRWTKTIDSMVTEMNSSSTSSTPSSCDVTGYANDTLTFTATRDDHNAIYKCEFIDGFSSGNYDEISLNVSYSIENIFITVTPDKPSYDQRTAYIDLECFSDGNPAASYIWLTEDNVTIGTDKLFHIHPVTEDKSGTYKCTATNLVNETVYELTTEVYLNIGSIPQEDKSFIESTGGIVTLSCLVIGSIAAVSAIAFKLLRKGGKVNNAIATDSSVTNIKIGDQPDVNNEEINIVTDGYAGMTSQVMSDQSNINIPPTMKQVQRS